MGSSARSRSAEPSVRIQAALARAFAPGSLGSPGGQEAPGGQGGAGAPGAPGQRPLRVCVGLSGGCDSVVLLHALAGLARSLRLDLRAVHVHHGLSANADQWARHCRTLCRRLVVPLEVVRVKVDRASGMGIEGAARQARLRVFRAQDAQVLVLAHHQDDQAETVLLQLLRGAGARGLSGMLPVSGADATEGGPRIVRPLLEVSRAALEQYAAQNGLRWIEDESNADTAFDRNFLRHTVLPLIEQRYPAARVALARSGRLLHEAQTTIESIAAQDLMLARDAHTESVSLTVLDAIGEARAREVLRAWLRSHGQDMPSERRLTEALRQAVAAGDNRQVEVALGTLSLRRYRQRLYLTTPPPPPAALPAALVSVQWNRRGRQPLPALGGCLLSVPTLGEGIAAHLLRGRALRISARAVGGDLGVRMQVGDRSMRRSLKNLWQESAVPPWLRDRWPLLWLDDELVCVPGVAIASGARAGPDQPGRVFRWLASGR